MVEESDLARSRADDILAAGVSDAENYHPPFAPQKQQGPPNIIFILADDLGYGDLSCYGQQKFSTPNLDRMAAEGMRFTDCYAGSTVCAPSRCALMTGLHGARLGPRQCPHGRRAATPRGSWTAQRSFFSPATTARIGKAGTIRNSSAAPVRCAGSSATSMTAASGCPEIAGVSFPPGHDGISRLPALLGRSQKSHDYLYGEFFERGFQQAVRMGDWKAVRLGPGQPLELYDLKKDIGEQNNVAAQHPDVVARIEKILKNARIESAHWRVPS